MTSVRAKHKPPSSLSATRTNNIIEDQDPPSGTLREEEGTKANLTHDRQVMSQKETFLFGISGKSIRKTKETPPTTLTSSTRMAIYAIQ